MAKGSHTSSILTGKDKRCYLTGETRGLEKHHIYFGAGLRQISDKHGFWVWLTAEKHRGTKGVHGRDGHALDLRLKQDCQRRFEEAHSRITYCRRHEHEERNRIQRRDRGLPLLRMPREDCRLPWDV